MSNLSRFTGKLYSNDYNCLDFAVEVRRDDFNLETPICGTKPNFFTAKTAIKLIGSTRENAYHLGWKMRPTARFGEDGDLVLMGLSIYHPLHHCGIAIDDYVVHCEPGMGVRLEAWRAIHARYQYCERYYL